MSAAPLPGLGSYTEYEGEKELSTRLFLSLPVFPDCEEHPCAMTPHRDGLWAELTLPLPYVAFVRYPVTAMSNINIATKVQRLTKLEIKIWEGSSHCAYVPHPMPPRSHLDFLCFRHCTHNSKIIFLCVFFFPIVCSCCSVCTVCGQESHLACLPQEL